MELDRGGWRKSVCWEAAGKLLMPLYLDPRAVDKSEFPHRKHPLTAGMWIVPPLGASCCLDAGGSALPCWESE